MRNGHRLDSACALSVQAAVGSGVVDRLHRFVHVVDSREALASRLGEVVDAEWSTMFEDCVLHPALREVGLAVWPVDERLLSHA